MTTAELSAVKRQLLEQRLRGRAGRAITPRPAGQEPPLSYAQERLWFMDQFAPGSTAYTIPVVIRLRGALDAGRLADALSAVVARHEALRCAFPQDEQGRPQLAIAAPQPIPIPVHHAADEDEARRVVADELGRPFDLSTGPLLRAALARLADDDHVLVLAAHHIASDGWSSDLLVSELFAHYAGEAPPELPIQYGDYAIWQRERLDTVKRADVDYWREALAGLEPLELPTDRVRPARQTFAGADCSAVIDADLHRDLRTLSRERNATLYMTLLAAVHAVLGRHSGQTDFAVGSPVAGRAHAEVEPLIGMFVNMITMRAALDGDPTFAQLLDRTRERALDAYSHQEVPFEQLVNELKVPRDVRRPPLFQVLFAVQNYEARAGATPAPAGLRVEPFPLPAGVTRFDLEIYAYEAGDELALSLIYNTDVYDAATVARGADHLVAFLRAVVADPDQRVSAVDLGAAPLPDAAAVPVDDATLPQLVAATARRVPDATAVVFEGQRLTYAQLDERADRVAAGLARRGVGPGDLVAVCAERSLELVVGLLGVLKSGAAYVPLDPEYPAERLTFMLHDAAAPVVLTQAKLADKLPPGALALDDPTLWPPAPAAGAGPARPDDIAYMIYTSGSTGRPKGVPNTHRGIVNRLDWMQRAYGLDGTDAVLQKTPASFDVSVWEFFWPLLTGARLVLAKPGGHKDADYLRSLMIAEAVTTVHFVPSMLAVFLAADGDPPASLRRVICSGEELPVDVARRCLAALPGAALHNLYGPTEAAVDVTAWPVTASALAGLARVPIGTPIQNMRVYVLDEHLRPAPVGVPGQLYLAGVGLARGYHRRPALTAERFLPDPFGEPGTRMYATGDLARWRDDGTIDFLGRIDGQVKLRGLRIELGEIEAALRAQPGVVDAAVVVREDVPGDKRLAAYVVGDADHAALRTVLKRRLPDYMVPAAFVDLPALPLSPSGKLDRRALPVPTVRRSSGASLVAPATPTEEYLEGLWRELLGAAPDVRLSVEDDFFDLGGHSMLATQVVARLRQRFGAGVSVLDVFANPTIRALAALIDTPADERGPRPLLHQLTKPVSAPTRSLVCVPYGGGSAVIYQPLADALPAGTALYSLAVPGNDIGLDEAPLPFDELLTRTTEEVLAKVDGPLVLYGHCVGSAILIELARRLEAAGRDIEAVYVGATFPFARPSGPILSRLAKVARGDRLTGNRVYENWLRSMGVDLGEMDPREADAIVRNMRNQARAAEDYFTDLFERQVPPLRAPIISVVGDRDSETDFYRERYREWEFLAPETVLVVMKEGGHYFLNYRADELARIVTTVHGTREAVAEDGWSVQARSASGAPAADGPAPSMGRFLTVAASQMVSIIGSALTEFALPLWIYTQTGSIVQFGLLAVLGILPGMLVAPLAGAIVDRYDRRRVMLVGDVVAGGSQAIMFALAMTGGLRLGHIYVLIVVLSTALTFQRLAYASAVPQLVPKRYLGHANGVVQMATGVGQFLVPLAAAALLAVVGLKGILLLDAVSYVIATAVVLATRFPDTLPWRRKEPLWQEIVSGLRYATDRRGFLPLLGFFAVLNVFLAPPFLLVSPLVLSFGDLGSVARVSTVAGLGAITGGLVMTIWGGPRQARSRGMLGGVIVLAASCVVLGLRPVEWLVAAAAFGMSFGLTLTNGIYATIVQVKVPQRFHGRVFAVNTVVAFSTIPLAYGVIAPFGSKLLEPLLAPDGALAGTVGLVIGTGEGRGIALLCIAFGLAMIVQALISLRLRAVGDFDARVPDALPDDLVGAATLKERT